MKSEQYADQERILQSIWDRVLKCAYSVTEKCIDCGEGEVLSVITVNLGKLEYTVQSLYGMENAYFSFDSHLRLIRYAKNLGVPHILEIYQNSEFLDLLFKKQSDVKTLIEIYSIITGKPVEEYFEGIKNTWNKVREHPLNEQQEVSLKEWIEKYKENGTTFSAPDIKLNE